MRRTPPQTATREADRLPAWETLVGGGLLRTTAGALAATFELSGPDPGRALRRAAEVLGAGWELHAETRRPGAADGAWNLTVTRRPRSVLRARRATLGRRRPREELLAAELQRQGEVEERLSVAQRRLGGPGSARRLDGGETVAHLHAALTGSWRPEPSAGRQPGLDAVLAAGALRGDDGPRGGDELWVGERRVVPVVAGTCAAAAHPRLLAAVAGVAFPHRVAVRPAALRRPAGDRPDGGTSLRRLLAADAAGSHRGLTTVLVVYDRRSHRAAERGAELARRLRRAGVPARVERARPADVFLASLPAHGHLPMPRV